MSFRAGDHVHHGPSGEDWILATDQEPDGIVFACGWPETAAKASDCSLLKAASDEERISTLRRVAECCVGQARGSCAQRQLEALEGTVRAAPAAVVRESSYSDHGIDSVRHELVGRPGIALHVHRQRGRTTCVELVDRSGNHVYLHAGDGEVLRELAARVPEEAFESRTSSPACSALCPCCREPCSGKHENQVHGVVSDNHWGGAKV